MKNLLVVAIVVLLSGCAAPALYQWGGYDGLLYQSYKNPEKSVDLRVKLEAHIAATELARQRVAPGLYAEVGTLYLQAGDTAKASAFYSRERATWPESRALMDALIKNIETQSAKPEAKS